MYDQLDYVHGLKNSYALLEYNRLLFHFTVLQNTFSELV